MASTLRLTYLGAGGDDLEVTLTKISGDDPPETPTLCDYAGGRYTAEFDIDGVYEALFTDEDDNPRFVGYVHLQDGQTNSVFERLEDIATLDETSDPIIPFSFIGPAYTADTFSNDDRDIIQVHTNKLDQIIEFVDELEIRVPADTPVRLLNLDATVSSRLSTAAFGNTGTNVAAVKASTDQLRFTNNRIDANVKAVSNTEVSAGSGVAFSYFFNVGTPVKTVNDVGVAGSGLSAEDVWGYSDRSLSEDVTVDISGLLTQDHFDSSLPDNFADLAITETDGHVTATGGSSGDWTTTELEQIRYRLGIDGDTDVPEENEPHLPVVLGPTIINNLNDEGEPDDAGHFIITQYSDYKQDTDVPEIGPYRVLTERPILREEDPPTLLFGATKKFGLGFYRQTEAGRHIQGTARAVAVDGEEGQYDIFISIPSSELGADKEPGEWGWDVDALFPDEDKTPLGSGTMTLVQSMGDREDRAE